MTTLDAETGSKLLQQMLDIWVAPEVRVGQDAGRLAKPLEMFAAQVVFFPDGRKPVVRINSDVKAVAEVKLKDGHPKLPGEAVYSQDVERINSVALSSEDDPDCGHLTAIRTGNTWTIAFDLRYNKGLARRHFETARQFYEAAEFSLKGENWTAFVDNLFSAAELAARAFLLAVPDVRFRKKTSHRDIQARFRRFAELGNVEHQHLDALNKLAGLRDRARYVRSNTPVDRDTATSLLEVVAQMLCEAAVPPDRIGVIAGGTIEKNHAVDYAGHVDGKPVVRKSGNRRGGTPTAVNQPPPKAGLTGN